jgi:hypothetical protein
LIALVRSGNIAVLQEALSGSGESQASASPPSWCVPGQPPELASVDAEQLLELRSSVETALRPAHGSGYAWGTIAPTDAWTDNPPLSYSTGDRWPGGFEIRQWAPDPQWGASYRDDIVGDVFLFTTSNRASRFFAEATSVRCHRSGSERFLARPPGARNLNWVNPDNATQEDIFLLRGRLVYRIDDVRPQNEEPRPSRAEKRVGVATVDVLACHLPGAGCPTRRRRPLTTAA